MHYFRFNNAKSRQAFGFSKMTDLLVHMKGSYDCILIDSAPVMPVTDTLHLMTMVDGVLLVVGPRISKQRVRRVCSRLNQIHAPLATAREQGVRRSDSSVSILA